MSKKDHKGKKQPAPRKIQSSAQQPTNLSPPNQSSTKQSSKNHPASSNDPIPLDFRLLDNVAMLSASNGRIIVEEMLRYLPTELWYQLLDVRQKNYTVKFD